MAHADPHHGHDHRHHGHAHGPGHHHHAPRDFGRAFAVGVALNSAFVVAEAGIGLWTGSLALLADAGHNLSDVLSLLLAWGATALARRPATQRRTYGFRKATVLASLANAGLLFVAVGVITSEAVRRFAEPAAIPTTAVAVVAAVGVAINFATALMFMRGSKHDLNARGAFLHMAADAAVSAAVVVGALAIGVTGWLWLDPAISLAIVASCAIPPTWRWTPCRRGSTRPRCGPG
jgi:cobalt-zinc-cadmium efflux system protein